MYSPDEYIQLEKYRQGHPELASDQAPAFPHRRDSVRFFEHGDDAGELPDDGEVDEADDVDD